MVSPPRRRTFTVFLVHNLSEGKEMFTLVILHKKYYNKSCIFSEMGHCTQFQELNCAGVAPSFGVCSVLTLVWFIEGN
jgi:hypothetical protein